MKQISILGEAILLFFANCIFWILYLDPAGSNNPALANWAVIIPFFELLIGLIPAKIATDKGRSFAKWWFYGNAIPLVAIIHSIFLKKNDEAIMESGMKKCPYCAEWIKSEAKVCRYCGRDL